MLGQREHQLSNVDLDKLLIEGKQKLRYFRLPKMFFVKCSDCLKNPCSSEEKLPRGFFLQHGRDGETGQGRLLGASPFPPLPAADGGRWVGGDDGGCSEAEVVHRSFVQQLLF